MAIEKAKAQKPGQLNLTWGDFIKDQILSSKDLVSASANKKATKPASKAKAQSATKTAKSKGVPAVKRGEPNPKDNPPRMMDPEVGAKNAKPIKSATPKKPLETKKATAKQVASQKNSKTKLAGKG